MTATSHSRAGPRWLGVKNLADRYDASKKTIYRMIDRGELPPPRRVGRLLRWHPDAISEWEASK